MLDKKIYNIIPLKSLFAKEDMGREYQRIWVLGVVWIKNGDYLFLQMNSQGLEVLLLMTRKTDLDV